MLEAKHSGSAIRNPSQALLAFKPRQVLLSQLTTTTTAMKQQRTKILTLNPDQKALLLRSVVRYLDCNGFSKPLKRLISDAHIQDDDWKTCSLNLEDMFANYLETCTNADTKFDTFKELDLVTNGTKKEEDDHSCSIEKAVVKKKKTKGGESDGIAALLPCGTTNNSADAAKICREMVADDGLTDLNIELKTKKKSKKLSDSVQGADQASEQAAKEPTPDTVSEMQPELSSKKKKEKKKKSKYISESLENNVEQEQLDSLPVEKEEKHKSVDLSLGDSDINSKAEVKSKDKKKKSKSSGGIEVPYKEGSTESKPKKEPVLNLEDGIQKEKKDSKKRKRLASDEEDTGTPYTNGDLENGDLSAGQESRRKERNSSEEPKTVNAFQRVKIDEVKFADERLQDNSYWAKDGAEVGYGAKAQEVLGQVRGRDFRHEKTKKKRGSYRGGQIDLHSHSVKFNYSDEE